MDQLLYTVSDCCRLLAIGRTKFYELAASGQIPIRKICSKTVVSAADLKRWADSLPTIEKQRSEPMEAEHGGGKEGKAEAHTDKPTHSGVELTESDRG